MIHLNENILKTKRIKSVDKKSSSLYNLSSLPPQNNRTSLNFSHPAFLESGISGTYAMIRCPITDI